MQNQSFPAEPYHGILHAGDWEAVLRPEIGGAIGRLRHKGLDILRPMDPASDNPLDAACFPLAPFCNRVVGGRFIWDGAIIALPINLPPDRSSLHGDCWQNAWQLTQSGPATAQMHYTYDGSAHWPWRYTATQVIGLDAAGFSLTLQLTNTSDTPMPAGLGLHPYFRRSPGTIIQFTCHATVLVDETLIPSGEMADAEHFAPWSAGTTLPRHLVDHCHTGWAGEVLIHDDLGIIRMQAEGADNLHIYAPPGENFLCCEPVSHTPDALNQDPQAMILLPPGANTSLTMRIGSVMRS